MAKHLLNIWKLLWRMPMLSVGVLVVSGALAGAQYFTHQARHSSVQHAPVTKISASDTHNSSSQVEGAQTVAGPQTGTTSNSQKKSTAGGPTIGQSPTSLSSMGQRSLIFSPSQVTLPNNGYWVNVQISASDGTKLYQPAITSSLNGVLASVNSPSPMGPGPVTQTTWTMQIHQTDYNSSGSDYLTITSSVGVVYSGKLKVTWHPIPSFYVTKGATEKIMTDTTVTYVMHFTLVTNQPYFGNPTIYTRVYSPNQYPGEPNDLCDGGVREASFVYDGQDDHTLTCVLNRPPLYVPGSGYPPPIPSSFGLTLDVYGKIGSDFIQGGTGEYGKIGYTIDPAPQRTD